MVSPLYWVSALTYAMVLFAVLVRDLHRDENAGKVERAFRRLIMWVTFFCVQDVFWGICAGESVKSDAALMIASTVFHASTVTTAFFWLDYVLIYLGDDVRHPGRWRAVDGVVVGIQFVLLLINFFYPVIFYVAPDGTYATAFLRPLAFLNQYMVYLIAAVCAAVHVLRLRGELRRKYLTVLAFAMAPVLSGVFQFLYPDGPFYSIGYFLGCVMIHLFVVRRDREELVRLQKEQKEREDEARMAEQIAISNTDRLTGLCNRRAYEDDLIHYPQIPVEEDYIYGSIDVNGLKTVNDTLGHAAGDELLTAAAGCLSQCLGSFGRIYRIGGDEFAAMIFASGQRLKEICRDLDEAMHSWHGQLVQELSLSYGFAARAEFPGSTVKELARVADDRMYQQKAAYYQRQGYDRRGQHTAYLALCASYEKILHANLTEDTYRIIRMDTDEKTSEMGFSEKLSDWLKGFGNSGRVHPEDLAEYFTRTDRARMQAYFRDSGGTLTVFYRRRSGDDYRRVMMELLPAEDYTADNQCVYLYVKDIDG